MAIHKGKCPNCGSILKVNTEKENHCIFCWAPVEAEQAIHLAEDSEGHVFEMKNYDEPGSEAKTQMLNNYGIASQANAKPRKTQSAKPVVRKQVEGKLSPAEQVAKMKVEIPEVHMNKKILGIVLGATAVVVLAVVGILWPLKNKQVQHVENLYQLLQIEEQNGPKLYIHGLNNQHLSCVRDEASETEVQQLYRKFKEAHEKEYGEKSSGLDCTVYTEKNSYLCNEQGVQIIAQPVH